MDISNFKEIHYVSDVNSYSIESSRVVVSADLYDEQRDLPYAGQYTPASGDVIYFLPGCNVPRMKVRDYCDKHGITVTKTLGKANIAFAGPDTKKEFLQEIEGAFLPKKDWLKWLRVCKSDDTEFVDDEITKVEEAPGDEVFVDPDVLSKIMGYEDCPWLDETVSVDAEEVDSRRYTRMKDVESLEDMPVTLNKVYSQDGILVGLNTQVIDHAMFEQLGQMLQSKDTGNATVAVEIMANCHYEKSIAYLLLLVRDHHGNIAKSKASGHVNFMALKQYLGVELNDSFNGDELVTIMAKKGQLNEENFQIIRPVIEEDMRDLLDRYSMSKFNITGVVIKPEYMTALTPGKTVEEHATAE